MAKIVQQRITAHCDQCQQAITTAINNHPAHSEAHDQRIRFDTVGPDALTTYYLDFCSNQCRNDWQDTHGRAPS